MPAFFSMLISIFILFPILLFVLILLVGKYWYENGKKSFRLAADITTFFLIVSVHFLIKTIFGRSFLIGIILLLLANLAIFRWLGLKLKGEMEIKRLLKGYWRFTFLLFLALYILLMMYGIFSGALQFLK